MRRRGIFGRAWQLYVAHIFLFVMFIAEVSYTVTTFNNPMYNDEMRVGDFLDEPHVAIVKALLLEFQPTFLDISAALHFASGDLPSRLARLALAAADHLVAFVPTLSRRSGHQSIGSGLSGGSRLVLQPSRLAVSVHRRSCARFSLAARAAMVEVGPRRLLPFAAVVVATGFVVKLSWTLHGIWDPFPGLFLQRVVAGKQEQFVSDPGHPVFRAVAVVAVVVPAQHGYSAFPSSETAGVVRSTVLGDLLPRHPAVGARTFCLFGIQFSNQRPAPR